MKQKIDDIEEIEDIELTDYPYLGIGKKPNHNKQHYATDEQLERIIGG
jgi:hypothetical protein